LFWRYIGDVGDVVVGRIIDVGQKRWKVDTKCRLDSALMLSSVNLPGGELVCVILRPIYNYMKFLKLFAFIMNISCQFLVHLNIQCLFYSEVESFEHSLQISNLFVINIKETSVGGRWAVDEAIPRCRGPYQCKYFTEVTNLIYLNFMILCWLKISALLLKNKLLRANKHIQQIPINIIWSFYWSLYIYDWICQNLLNIFIFSVNLWGCR